MFAYLDLDFNDSRAAYKRAVDFVAKYSIKYKLSSNVLHELGGQERKSIAELVSADYEFSQLGRVQTAPQAATRLVFELFPKESPLAVENFVALCSNSKGKSKQSSLPLHYLNNKLHRYSKDLGIIQGGDIQFGNGSGGESIWGKKFKDDPKGLKLKHDRRGVLSMGNGGKNSNTSQFFVTLRQEGCPKCDKKHVVFGKLIHGFDTLDLLQTMVEEAGGVSKEDEFPPFDIVITGCGVWDPSTMPCQGHYAADDCFVEKSSSTAQFSHDEVSDNLSENTRDEKMDNKGGGALKNGRKDRDVVGISAKKGDMGRVKRVVEKVNESNQNDKALGMKLKQLEEGFETLSTTTYNSGNNVHSEINDFDDDFFGDQEEGSELNAAKKTQDSVANKLYNDGYRIGKVQEEERLFQQGFDTGLKEGIRVGLLVGSFVAKIRHLMKSSPSFGSASGSDGPLIEYLSGKFIENYEHDKHQAKTLLRDLWNSCFPFESSHYGDSNKSDKEQKDFKSAREAWTKLHEELQGNL